MCSAQNNIFVENDMRGTLEFILEKIISLLLGITIEKAQVHSNALKAVMYRGIVILLP